MLSRVNLVAILLTLNCVTCAMEYSRSSQEKRPEEDRVVLAPGRKILRYAYSNVTSESSPPTTKVAKVRHIRDIQDDEHSKSLEEKRDQPRLRNKRMDRTMLALLMAYKLKFIALIPTMLGGLILLKGTTLLAGFFFALFAAVLGLKAH